MSRGVPIFTLTEQSRKDKRTFILDDRYYVAGIGATESRRMNEENAVHDAASHLRLLSILPLG